MIAIYYKLANSYKFGFLEMFACCIILLIILPIIISVKDYYEHYSDIRLGFLPDLAIQISEPYNEHRISPIVESIKSKYSINFSLQGAMKNLTDSNFKVQQDVMNDESFFETIHKKMVLLGIDFQGSPLIQVLQDHKVSCEVKQLGEFGHWYIDVYNTAQLKTGNAYIIDGNNRINVRIFKRKDYYRIRYDETGNDDDIPFFDFLNHFISRFQKTAYSGIDADRFSSVKSDTKIDYFNTHLKRQLLAYAGLIFPPHPQYLSTIVSSNLLHSINKYDYITMANLSSKRYNIPIIAHDAFYFLPEQKLNNNLLLSNIKQFHEFIQDSDSQSFIYIYCESSYIDDIIKDIKKENIQATFLSRKQIVPSYFTEKGIVIICISTLYFLLILLCFCISFIKLIKFYSVFQDDLTLLKLYGYNFSIFSVSVIIIVLSSNIVSAFILNLFFNWNNQLLNTFYYPSIIFNWTNYLYTTLIFYSVVGFNYLCELYLLNNISYASRGKNQ